MKLALIGSGNMGQALVRGFLRQNKLTSRDLSIYDIDQDKARCFAEETGGKSFPSAAEAVSGADIVLLAVKPLVIQAAITDFADHLTDRIILVSIAAGVSLANLRRLTGPGPTLVRIMPNTPAMIGSGVSAVCFDQADQRQQQLVEDLFASCGLVVTVNEDLMDAANIIENEKVQVVNINNGERLETYVIKGERGSGTVCMNGAAARKAAVGDLVIIISYAMMDFEEAKTFKPSIIFPEAETNRLV